MADLKNFVKNVIHEVLKTDYPALTSASCEAGCVKRASGAEGRYIYTVRVLDANGREDPDRAELTGILSDQEYHEGDVVVLLYVSGARPYIAGRWLV